MTDKLILTSSHKEKDQQAILEQILKFQNKISQAYLLNSSPPCLYAFSYCILLGAY